jgi:transcriptional regulator with XRE-family HTH domain
MMPFCHVILKVAKPIPPAYPKGLRSLGDHLRKRRLDMRMSQAFVAELLGVDKSAIVGWEANRRQPYFKSISKIIQFLGYNPYGDAKSPGERIIILRRLLGVTQKELADRIGVDYHVIGPWEQGKCVPLGHSLEKLDGLFSSIADLS